MQTLNPIQILDIKTLVVTELANNYKKLTGCGTKQLVLSSIANFEKALPILDTMYEQAIKDEDRILAGEDFAS